MKKRVWSTVATLGLLASACEEAAEAGPLRLGTSRQPVFAVQLRSMDGAGIGLLDEDGEIIREHYLTSGTELSGEGGFLHTDISVPSNPDIDGVLAILARSPENYLLRFDYFNGQVFSQVKTQPDAKGDAAAYSSNPYDYLLVNEDLAWVTRFEPNLDPKAEEMLRGDDLLALNPTTGKLIKRVDLGALREEVSYSTFDMEQNEMKLEGTAYARPNKLIGLKDGLAYVGLDRLTADFQGAAEGAGLVFDTDKGTFTKVEIAGMKNCGEAVRVVGKDDAVIVPCIGSPWGSPDSAGLVYIEIEDGKGEVKHTYRPSDDAPFAVFSPISLGGTVVAATASGWATGSADQIFRLDLETGDTKLIKEFKEESDQGVVAFGGAFNPNTGMLLVGDRGNVAKKRSPSVLRFSVNGSKVSEEDALPFPEKLPVDAIVALVRY